MEGFGSLLRDGTDGQRVPAALAPGSFVSSESFCAAEQMQEQVFKGLIY